MSESAETPAPPAALAARKRSNLAFALVSLGKARRDAMGVFYDFCRLVDDIADEPVRTTPRKYGELRGWCDTVLSWASLWQTRTPTVSPLLADVAPIPPDPDFAARLRRVCETYAVNPQDVLDIIGGVAQDVEPRTFADFEALRGYCYGVASAVGLVSIKIFGCVSPKSPAFAEALGYALQFTNILRDIREDFEEKGRVYLPQDELDYFGVTPEILLSDTPHAGRAQLLRLQYFRAKHFFNRARRLLTQTDKNALRAARVMGAIYEEILERIKAADFSLARRVSLSKPRKIALLFKTLRQLKKPLPRLRAPEGRVCVLGAGVAGISAAALLAYEGFDVDLLEAKKVAGGRACALDDKALGCKIDNGQHAIFGCYRAFLGVAELLGVSHRLDKAPTLSVAYFDKGGKRFFLKARDWPFGLGMMAALWGFKKLSFRDKWGIAKFAVALRAGARPDDGETAAHWLARHGQSDGAMRGLWTPFCVAALNRASDTASAALLRETLVRALFAKPADAAIYLTHTPLGDLLYPSAARFLKSVGGTATLGAQVQRLEGAPDGTYRYFLNGDTTGRAAALAVCALNPGAAAALLPEGATKDAVGRIARDGILNAHLLCDTALFDDKLAGFLDSPVHWVFDRTELLPKSEQTHRRLYAVTLSAPGALLDAAADEILALVELELRTHFPRAKHAKFLAARLVKTRDATFAATPETERLRPAVAACLPLLLAGDYTATGLPATLEGAAQSAYAAVRAVDDIPV